MTFIKELKAGLIIYFSDLCEPLNPLYGALGGQHRPPVMNLCYIVDKSIEWINYIGILFLLHIGKTKMTQNIKKHA